MDLTNQIIFLLSALGGLNALVLAGYLTYATRKDQSSNYFLPLLLIAVSIRVIKSVFFYYNPNLSGIFIQIGLSGCVLIGPLLYLYLKKENRTIRRFDYWHPLAFLIVITILGIFYPYTQHRSVWSRYIILAIYYQWFFYIIAAFPLIKHHFSALINKKAKIKQKGAWQLSVYIGIACIWLAYKTVKYTSYIVGALSSTFIFYLMILLIIFRYQKKGFLRDKLPYQDKSIDPDLLAKIESKLPLIQSQKLYLDANLTLPQVSKEVAVPAHILSQYLNDHLNKSFSHFINEMRIQHAQTLLINDDLLTIETLGYQSGYNSKSAFYSSFKKIAGMTPNQYRLKYLKED